ncbi:hypothetical protein RFI_12871, partial [Reticulomyxa filosa]
KNKQQQQNKIIIIIIIIKSVIVLVSTLESELSQLKATDMVELQRWSNISNDAIALTMLTASPLNLSVDVALYTSTRHHDSDLYLRVLPSYRWLGAQALDPRLLWGTERVQFAWDIAAMDNNETKEIVYTSWTAIEESLVVAMDQLPSSTFQYRICHRVYWIEDISELYAKTLIGQACDELEWNATYNWTSASTKVEYNMSRVQVSLNGYDVSITWYDIWMTVDNASANVNVNVLDTMAYFQYWCYHDEDNGTKSLWPLSDKMSLTSQLREVLLPPDCTAIIAVTFDPFGGMHFDVDHRRDVNAPPVASLQWTNCKQVVTFIQYILAKELTAANAQNMLLWLAHTNASTCLHATDFTHILQTVSRLFLSNTNWCLLPSQMDLFPMQVVSFFFFFLFINKVSECICLKKNKTL